MWQPQVLTVHRALPNASFLRAAVRRRVQARLPQFFEFFLKDWFFVVRMNSSRTGPEADQRIAK